MTVPGLRAGTPTVWSGDIPRRNKNFTGRLDILTRLKERSADRVMAVLPQRDPDNPLPQAVQGYGGVGKTAIAIEFAYRYAADYDVVWWIPADQLSSARGAIVSLAEKLDLDPSSSPEGVDGTIKDVLDALRRGVPYQRWLLIFDNADNPDHICPLLPGGPGDVLITSRNHEWQPIVDTISMDVFAREESVEFLLKRVPRGLSAADADRLAEELGDLPLALDQAGALLSESGMSADEYLSELSKHVSRIMDETTSVDYPMSMTAAWRLSVSTLRAKQPLALELLRCCAFFGPAPIPRGIFPRGAVETGSRVSEVVSDPILLSRAIRMLGRYAMVTVDGTSLSVHRLIQALIRDDMTPEDREAYRREAQLIMANAAPDNPDLEESWPIYEELLPHVTSDSTELYKSADPKVRDLARRTMRFLYQAGDYPSAQALTERYIEQWRDTFGPDDPDVLRAQRHLGNIQRLIGRYAESYRVTYETLAKSQKVLGEDDATTLTLRTAFAADLRARGSFAEARRWDEESRERLELIFGSGDTRTLRLLSSLALDYGLTSDYAEARKLYDEAYRAMRRTKDATATDVLGAWIGLSWTLRLMGSYEEAYEVGEDARDYGEASSHLGPEHLSTLRSRIGWTIVCRRIEDKRPEALRVAREMYDLMTHKFGPSHPDTLAIAVSLSNLLRATDERYQTEALDLAEKTAAMYPAVYGPQHPYNFGCMGNVALMRRVTGNPEGARQLDQEAYEGLLASLGPDHHYTLTAAMNLASDHAVLGHWETARRIDQDTFERLGTLLGSDHPHTLGCESNLALDLTELGDVDAGRQHAQHAIFRLQQTQGHEFPDTVVAEQRGRLDPDFDPPPI